MLESLEFFNLKIPFKVNFRHHSAERKETQTVIVIAGDGSFKGFGEGCPREYVTNESLITAERFFAGMKGPLLAEVGDLGSLRSFIARNELAIESNHAAWCAIELALIDLFAKQNGCSAETLLQQPELADEFQYTGIIGDGPVELVRQVALKHIQLGFRDFKIKISGDQASDYEKIRMLKEMCRECRIRLDANNTWKDASIVAEYVRCLPAPVFAIEEPLHSKSIDELGILSRSIGVPIILDESLSRIGDLRQVILDKGSFIVNLRISKMGGLLNSLKMIELCIKEELKVIVGAQVGETSILTRAGLLAANALPVKSLIGMEGAYGTYLLERDIVETPLMFGPGGLLRPKPLLNSGRGGFQLEIEEGRIAF